MSQNREESQSTQLPPLSQLSEELRLLIGRSESAKRCLDAVTEGVFVHPDGSRDSLYDTRIAPQALALIAHLNRNNPTRISIDVGFGMGSSAAMAMAARKDQGADFIHYVFDPWGIGNGLGEVVERYLKSEFGESFHRVWKPSEIGLGQLLDERGPGCAGFIFIDGNHTFEQVITDFVLADGLCAVGGYILFDDAQYPAIETVIEYIRANRDDYEVWHLPVANTSVVRKMKAERPAWYTFQPFPVAPRVDFTPAAAEWDGDLPFAQVKNLGASPC
jgi:hypothetical protein